jgi:hypothetical protein
MATIIPCASPREQWCLYTDSIGEVACANIMQIMSVVLYTLGIEYMCANSAPGAHEAKTNLCPPPQRRVRF